MFRIVRVFDTRLSTDARRVDQVQEILRDRRPREPEGRIVAIPGRLNDPVKHGLRAILFVAEDEQDRVRGFALLYHDPGLDLAYLDCLFSVPGRAGSGVGGALYERVRDEAVALDCVGLFFESGPDDSELCPDAEQRKRNRKRLRFYERYGARPVAGTLYEASASEGTACCPYLMLDPLGRDQTPSRQKARPIVRAILEREHGDTCTPERIETVVRSFKDRRLQRREPRYAEPVAAAPSAAPPPDRRILLVVNEKHDIHHIRERGYVESPVRVSSILDKLEATRLCERVEPRRFPDATITAVHDPEYVQYLEAVCKKIGGGRSVYPSVFPLRNQDRRPADLLAGAGYYCMDTSTPLTGAVYPAARRAVDCALTAADAVRRGRRLAYALIRPPGHHAERRIFGGFCYFSNSAIAAQHLCGEGRVAILDIDYHHGNGQQAIFYERNDVLTVSIHGHPRNDYPYFAGFPEEIGDGPGEGYNLNIPLGPGIAGKRYRKALRRALERVEEFDPLYLIVALGLDPAKGDPTGSWLLTAADFEANGRAIGALRLPTVVIQEGGYRLRTLGVNVVRFLGGLSAETLG